MSKTGRFFFMQFAGIVALIAAIVLACRFLPVRDSLQAAEVWLAEAGPLGMVLFPALYAAANVLLLPGGILNIGAGFFFGVWQGFLLVLAGSILSTAITFWIGRTFGRKWIEKRMLRQRRWMRLDQAIAREGWKIIVLSQLNPLLPTSLINYFYGMSRIRFWSCVFWVAVGQAPARLLYAYLGAAGQYSLMSQSTAQTPLQQTIFIGGLIVAVAATAVLGAVAHNIMKRLGAEPDDEEDLGDTAELPTTTPALR